MKALFQNPKLALAYVGITMASVALFVGTEDSPGSLDQTVQSFGGKSAGDRAAHRKFGDPPPGEDTIGGKRRPRQQEQKREIIEFVDDEDLIDDAQGFDPTPKADFSGYNPDPDKRPFLSDQDKKKAIEDDGGWGVSDDD